MMPKILEDFWGLKKGKCPECNHPLKRTTYGKTLYCPYCNWHECRENPEAEAEKRFLSGWE
jgi:uncharacterized Zn finger protein (UPF0148 family)